MSDGKIDVSGWQNWQALEDVPEEIASEIRDSIVLQIEEWERTVIGNARRFPQIADRQLAFARVYGIFAKAARAGRLK
jgi:hypothetical protein